MKDKGEKDEIRDARNYTLDLKSNQLCHVKSLKLPRVHFHPVDSLSHPARQNGESVKPVPAPLVIDIAIFFVVSADHEELLSSSREELTIQLPMGSLMKAMQNRNSA